MQLVQLIIPIERVACFGLRKGKNEEGK